MKRQYLFLILIIALAVFFRFYKITSIPPGLYPDEAINGNQAHEAWQNKSWKIFYPENNGREGLFINIQSFSLALFGPEPWALRIVSAIFGNLTILGLYFLTRELFLEKNHKQYQNSNNQKINKFWNLRNWDFIGNWKLEIGNFNIIALAAAFFLTTSFWHINFSRIGFRAIMVPFLTVWLFYFLFKMLDSNINAKRYTLYAISAGLFFGLGFHTYIAFRVVPALVGLVFIYDSYNIIKKRRRYIHSELSREGIEAPPLSSESWVYRRLFFLKWITFFLTAFIIVLPIGLYFWNHPEDFIGRTGQVSIFASENPIKSLLINTGKTLAMFNFVGDWNWRHNFSGSPQLFWPVGILFLIGIILSFSYLITNTRKYTQSEPSRGAVLFWAKSKFNGGDVEALPLSGESWVYFRYLFLIIWFFMMLLPTVLSNEGLPHALRSIGAIPPVFIFAGLGFNLVYNHIKKTARNFFIKPAFISILWGIFFISLTYQVFDKYFIQWANHSDTRGAFAQNYIEQAKYLNNLPLDFKKYVIVEANGVFVNGTPMPAQTIMFITKQKPGQNISYLLPKDGDSPPHLFDCLNESIDITLRIVRCGGKIIKDEKTAVIKIK